MKALTIIVLSLSSLSLHAAEQKGLSEAEMQSMMGPMMEVQACMSRIDKSKFDDLERRHKQFDKDLRALCSKGDRDGAQRLAHSYAIKMSNDGTIKEVKKCGSMAEGMMPGISSAAQDHNNGATHVCDSR